MAGSQIGGLPSPFFWAYLGTSPSYMKYTLTALALASFSAGAYAQSAPAQVASSDLTVRGGISWSGSNVFRGVDRSNTTGLVQSDVTAEYNIPGFSGLSAYLSFYDADSFERSYTLGARTDDGIGKFDIGVTKMTSPVAHNLQDNGFSQLRSNVEVYVGQTFTKISSLTPSATFYYSSDTKGYTLDLAIKHTIKGASVGVPGVDFVLKANAGLTNADAVLLTSSTTGKDSYLYIGGSADVVRAVGQGAEIGAGVNYAYNTDGLAQTHGSTWFAKVFVNFKF